MLLARLVEVSAQLARTSKRLEKIGLLSELLRQTPVEAVPSVVAFLCGNLRQGRIGLGGTAVREGLSARPAEAASLTVGQVEGVFDRIAAQTGPGSAGEKRAMLRGLMAQATREEQPFLAGLLLGELRQGALEGSMADAVARACRVTPAQVRRAWMLCGDLSETAYRARKEGAEGLSRLGIRLFRPVAPMLAGSAEDAGQALERLEEAAFEFKMDGARVQVHKSGDDVRVFSRGLKDVTEAVPEIVESVAGLGVRELVLDGEALALRPDGRPYPFQNTMRRFGRRLDVEAMRRKLPLSCFFFDCLYLDGSSMIDADGQERFRVLEGTLPANLLVPRIVTADPDRADAFLQEALGRGHEGVMAKSLQAVYKAGSRGKSWLKIKQVHTLDLVVLAAEWGHGRRRGWLSNLHLGARDASSGGWVMLGKTFKGLTDKTLEWQTRRLLELETRRDDWTVYVRPELVVEIAFNELQKSSQYPGGLALRFARVKTYRPDKTPEEASTITQARALHHSLHTTPPP